MEYSKYRFNLDMQSYISQVSLPVRQHDTGIVLRINLTDGGVPYVIKDGCRAVFYARKSDGNPLMNDCVIEKNTTICYELTQQTTSCSGVVDCEVRLYGADGNLITTPRFILVVDSRVVHDEDFPLSEAEQTVLDNIILSETKRQQNEEEREETHNKMLAELEEASSLADALRNKLETGDYDGITPHIGANGNWWFGDEDSGVLASGYTIPLRVGAGKNSIEQQAEEANHAITEGSAAFGEGNIAGARGYYISEIYYGNDTSDPQVKVSNIQPEDLYISPSKLQDLGNTVTPEYAVGDIFNLICNDHFVQFGKIVSIDHEVITFTGDIEAFKSGLTSEISKGHAKMVNNYYVNLVPQYDDYTLCVPSKPLVGIVEICKNAYSSGYGNISAGEEGTALGARTIVVGAYGHTSGKGTLAGYAASAEGSGSQAPAKYSHAQNINTKASGFASTAMGDGTTASGKNALSKGANTKATGENSEAGGKGTIASGANAVAEGLGNGVYDGVKYGPSEASGIASHVEGVGTKATHDGAHAENFGTTASGKASHAGGIGTEAAGKGSFTHGFKLKATRDYQAVFGMYNKENPDAVFIVGNGTTPTNPKNALEVLKDGNIIISEKIYGTEDLEAGISALPTGALYFVYE